MAGATLALKAHQKLIYSLVRFWEPFHSRAGNKMAVILQLCASHSAYYMHPVDWNIPHSFATGKKSSEEMGWVLPFGTQEVKANFWIKVVKVFCLGRRGCRELWLWGLVAMQVVVQHSLNAARTINGLHIEQWMAKIYREWRFLLLRLQKFQKKKQGLNKSQLLLLFEVISGLVFVYPNYISKRIIYGMVLLSCCHQTDILGVWIGRAGVPLLCHWSIDFQVVRIVVAV